MNNFYIPIQMLFYKVVPLVYVMFKSKVDLYHPRLGWRDVREQIILQRNPRHLLCYCVSQLKGVKVELQGRGLLNTVVIH